MKSEDVVQAEIRAEAGKRGIHLWRNNSGAMSDATGRVVRFGLGNDSAQLNRRIKSSDLIGVFESGYITPAIHSDKAGRFLAIECKEEGWRFPESWRHYQPDDADLPVLKSEAAQRVLAQWRFLTLVHNAGGLAGFATSLTEFSRILNGELVLP